MEPGLRENPVGKSVHVYSYFTFIERVILDSCITKCIYLFIIFYLKLTSHHRMPAETKGEWTKRTLFKHTSLLKNSNDIFICCGFLLFCSMFMICSCAREGREEAILLHKKNKTKNSLMKFLPLRHPFGIYCPTKGQQHESPHSACLCEFLMCVISHVSSCPLK